MFLFLYQHCRGFALLGGVSFNVEERGNYFESDEERSEECLDERSEKRSGCHRVAQAFCWPE